MEINNFTVIEWFSGIGGLRFAFEALSLEKSTKFNFIAFDINEVANLVYSKSFKGDDPRTKSIESLSLADIESLNGYIWLLSPPCQPYTLGGSQLDDKDSRARAILHLISVLHNMENPPEFLFLENVPRFESSSTRNLLVETLVKRGYYIEEYLITPTDPVVTIPNSRLRYYLSARKNNTFPFPVIEKGIITSLESVGFSQGQFSDGKVLSDYIIDNDSVELIVSSKAVEKEKGFNFDLISQNGVPLGHRSAILGIPACSTFTKGYGSNRIRGTGSLILLQELSFLNTSDIDMLLKVGLRYFSPNEISSLHGFPTSLNKRANQQFLIFPESITLIQKYRLLGNSLNIRVVSILLSRLLSIPFKMNN